MDSATRVETAGLETAASLADDIKNRSPDAAAEKLVDFGPSEIATALMQVAPGFAQDVLAALPDVTRELVFAAAPDEVAAQWQRNALYDRDAIGRALSVLSRGQREAVVMVEWLGMTDDEAGALLGISPVTVRVRIHRARAVLRPLLREGDDG